MRVYWPAWFSIKISHSCTSVSKHLCNVIKNSRYLSDHLKKVMDPVISRSAFMAHPETLLPGMFADERRHIQELVVRRIIKVRELSFTVERRHFVVPNLNFKASPYIDMIDWFKCDITGSAIAAYLTVEELKSIADNGSIMIYKSTNFHVTPNRLGNL